MRARFGSIALRLSLALGALLAAPGSAHACGGLFCSATPAWPVPIVQAGEQIVYAIDADGSLTMSVRIYYDGSAPEFAWILPVPETPAITLGSAAFFDWLDAVTRPTFSITDLRTEGVCRPYPTCEFPPFPDTGGWSFADASVGGDGGSGAGPTIYAESSLGPFETVVIGGASATEIHAWLAAHGYDLPTSAIPLLDAYVAAGQRFVALRLGAAASVGEIQPVTLGFGAVAPCLPIRLTAIATEPDLPITAFFLADARATPRNYSLIEMPYPATLWRGTVSYEQWVSDEADALGGHAFIADYAGATPMGASLSLPPVGDLATAASAGALVCALRDWGYSSDPQLLGLLSRFITPPGCTNASGYFGCLAGPPGIACTPRDAVCGLPESFDPAGLALAIEMTIRQPRLAADAMLAAHPYTTRLYTTMSAEEMSIDPEFVLDAGLDGLANVHTAIEVTECDAAHFQADAAQRLELPDGTTLRARLATTSGTDAEYCAALGGWLPGMEPDAGAVVTMDGGAGVMDGGADAATDGGPGGMGGGGGPIDAPPCGTTADARPGAASPSGCACTAGAARAPRLGGALLLGVLVVARRRRPRWGSLGFVAS